MHKTILHQWRLVTYVILVVIWTIAQLVTDGAYFPYLTLAGIITGYSVGIGIESRRLGLETEESISRVISRGALYALPFGLSGSLLGLTRFGSNSTAMLGAVFMLVVQVGVIVYLSRTA